MQTAPEISRLFSEEEMREIKVAYANMILEKVRRRVMEHAGRNVLTKRYQHFEKAAQITDEVRNEMLAINGQLGEVERLIAERSADARATLAERRIEKAKLALSGVAEAVDMVLEHMPADDPLRAHFGTLKKHLAAFLRDDATIRH